MASTNNPFESLETRLERIEGLVVAMAERLGDLPKADPLPELLTRRQAAEYLSLSVQSVDALCRSGGLEKVYIGGSPRFRREDLRKLSEKWSKGQKF